MSNGILHPGAERLLQERMRQMDLELLPILNISGSISVVLLVAVLLCYEAFRDLRPNRNPHTMLFGFIVMILSIIFWTNVVLGLI